MKSRYLTAILVIAEVIGASAGCSRTRARRPRRTSASTTPTTTRQPRPAQRVGWRRGLGQGHRRGVGAQRGSNKANEFLRSRRIDFGSTAGAAALLARANGSPIKTVYLFSKPEWTALVVGRIRRRRTVAELQGQEGRRDQGHRPLLLPAALSGGRACRADVEVVNLQHADGTGGPGARRGRCLGRPRSAHGAPRRQRLDDSFTATLPSTPTAPQRARGLPHPVPGRRPARSSTPTRRPRPWIAANPDQAVNLLARESKVSTGGGRSSSSTRAHRPDRPTRCRAPRAAHRAGDDRAGRSSRTPTSRPPTTARRAL